jgi:outer membrane protein assembly factor BamD (BamD/ComL family)
MSTSSSVKSSRETTSENERALIEQARDALAASRFVDVDAALSRHRARHADGVLAEDRDALTVLSLLKQGQIDHARAAARRFDERFPESLYRPRIRAAFASITPSSP